MQPLLIHIHVPKCAGTTIETHLKEHLDPRAFWMPAKRTASVPLELFARKYRTVPTLDAERIAAVSGHYAGHSVERRFLGRRIYRSILLRDPVDLMISWYNFRMARYLAAGQRSYSFATHMRALPADPVAHSLLDRWLELPYAKIAAMRHQEKCRRLDQLFASMDFIGDLTDCDRLTAWIGDSLAIPAQAPAVNTFEQRNRAGGWRKITRDDLEPEILAELQTRTRLDDWLWQRWAKGRQDMPEPARSYGFARVELRRAATELVRMRLRGKAMTVRPSKIGAAIQHGAMLPGE